MESYDIAAPFQNIPAPFHNIHLIVNPASGTDGPPLAEIKAHFEAAGVGLKLHETQPEVSARQLALLAVSQGADLVIACGGDGTVTTTAEGLLGSQVPLGIIPQGTANVFAAELKLPLGLPQVLNLFTTGEHDLRQVDVGQVGNRGFLLRLGIGWEAAMTVLAPADLKSRYGRWAYLMNAFHIRRRLKVARYQLVIDGQPHLIRGVSCVICNSGNVGLPGLKLLPDIEVDDGLLNVVIIRRADLKALLSLAIYVARCALSGYQIEIYPPQTLSSWKGREISVTVEPDQVVARDGEVVEGAYPLEVHILPAALRVVAPAQAKPPGS